MNPHPLQSLSALLDDELGDAERRAVEAHLASCPSCARHLRELAAVDALARGLPPVTAPEGYLEGLPARVRLRIRADRPAGARAPWVWPLAAGLALALLAPIVLRDGPSPSPPAEDARTAEAIEEGTASTLLPDFAAEKDARPLARARQGTPRRAAPAAPAAPPPPSAKSVAAADTQAARAMEMRDDVAARERDQPAFAPASAAEAEESKRTEGQARGQAAGGMSATLRKSERANVVLGSSEEDAFRSIAALPLSTAAEARRARQAWVRFAAEHPRGARRDEALVRIVEASVAAFRAGRDSADRLAARKDAATYLSTEDAPQAARVQAALRRLDEPR